MIGGLKEGAGGGNEESSPHAHSHEMETEVPNWNEKIIGGIESSKGLGREVNRMEPG